MQKNLYFISPNHPNFIEVSNTLPTKRKFKVYFEGDSLATFKCEGISCSSYNSFENSFELDIDTKETKYLEIYPSCGDVDIESYIYAIIETEERDFHQTYKLSLNLRKERNERNVSRYSNLSKGFENYQKNENDTCYLYESSHILSGNIKLYWTDSDNLLYLSLFDEIENLNDDFKHQIISKNSDYANEIGKLFSKIERKEDVIYRDLKDRELDVANLKNQKDLDIYKAGIRRLNSSVFKETHSFFAPLYIESKIPKKFVIFKRNNFKNLKKEDILNDIEIVKTFDLSLNSLLGKFLFDTVNLENFEKSHLETVHEGESVLLDVTGFDSTSRSIITLREDVTSLIKKESTLNDFESYIGDIYKRRGLVSHRLFNLEFCLNLEDEGNISSYFGLYVDDLDLENLELDLSIYGNGLLNNCRLNKKIITDNLIVNSSLGKYNNYLKNRIFYLKDLNENLYSIDSLQNNEIQLKDSVNLCNFINTSKENLIRLNSEKCEKVYSFYQFELTENFKNNFQIEVGINNKIYKFIFKDELENLDILKNVGSEEVYPLNYVSGEIKLPKRISLDDLSYIDLLEGENKESIQIASSYNDGDTTYIKISDSIDLDGITHISYSSLESDCIEVLIGSTLEQSLNNLYNKVLSLDFTLEIYGRSVLVVSKNYDFSIKFNSSYSDFDLSTIYQEGELFNLETNTVKNTTTISRVYSDFSYFVNDGYIYEITENEKDLLDIDNKLYVNSKSVSKELDKIREKYFVKYKNGYVIKVKDCESSIGVVAGNNFTFGLCSIYDIKKFDTTLLYSNYDFIKDEYKRIFKNFKSNDILESRSVYVAINSASDLIHLELQYKTTEGFKRLVDIYIGAKSTNVFSTFLTDYDINLYNSDTQFRFILREGNSENLKVYNAFIFTDPDLYNASPDFINSPYLTNDLIKYIQDLKDFKNPDFIWNFDSRSEYTRLQEFSRIDTLSRNLIKNNKIKWTSKNKNGRGLGYRLNYSLALGKTNSSPVLSDYISDETSHSHEWFMIDEVPGYLKYSKKQENNYIYTQINKGLLQDVNYDYFTEYFTNGYLNVKNQDFLDLGKTENYSIFKKYKEGVYETFYRGVKYRFASAGSLEGYKFGIVYSSRPPLITESSIVDHCADSNFNASCKRDGILPKLKDAISDLFLGNQTVNIYISMIQPSAPVVTSNIASVASVYETGDMTQGEFINEIKGACSKWKSLLESLFNTSKGFGGNLTVNFHVTPEVGAYPVTENFLTDSIKTAYNIGDIRVAYGPLEDGDIAKSVYISYSKYQSTPELLTPLVILNSKAFFRKNSSSPSNKSYSLQYVFAHELGHSFGLSHLDRKETIMYPTIKGSDILNTITGINDCIYFIYGNGKNFLVEEAPTNFSCSSHRNRKKDSFEFIVNDTFKNITLLIYVDLPSYLSQDSKKSFVDFYVSDTSKRIIKYNDTYAIEGNDIKIPSLDLSLNSSVILKDRVILKSSEKLRPFEIGNNSSLSAYRIRNLETVENNFSIDHFTLDYDNSNWYLKKSFDSSGIENKPYLSRIYPGSDTTVHSEAPLLNRNEFLNSFVYRIAGGGSVNSFNYKLTLDYLSEISDSIPIVGTVNRFDFSIVSPDKIQIEEIQKVNQIKEDQNIFFIAEHEKRGDVSIYRYEQDFNPMLENLIDFSIREDYDFSLLIGMDLFKLNTLINLNSDFGKFSLLEAKTFDKPALKETERFSLFLENGVLSNKYSNIYSSSLNDDYYDYWLDSKNKITLSSLYDPNLQKNILNSLVLTLKEEIEFNLLSSDITLLENSKITFDINNITSSLTNYLVEILKVKYLEIYNTGENWEDSLKRFIVNNINFYSLESIKVYSKISKDIRYNSNLTEAIENTQISTENLENGKIRIRINTDSNLEFFVKLKFKTL